MKSRSEVIAERKAAAQKKPSAVERTEPLLPEPEGKGAIAKALIAIVGAKVKCKDCDVISDGGNCSTRGDGIIECPDCGGAVEVMAEGATSTRVDAKPAPTPKPTLNPTPRTAKAAPQTTAELAAEVDAKQAAKRPEVPAKYCGACGHPLTWAAGVSTYFFGCGHTKETAGMVNDPKDAKPSTAVAGVAIATELAPIEPHNRISIPWGKARCPVDRFNSFEVGGFIVTVDVKPGEDRVAVAKTILAELKEIAELAFQEQRAWYEKKLSQLGVE